jgi:hypothetical protein
MRGEQQDSGGAADPSVLAAMELARRFTDREQVAVAAGNLVQAGRHTIRLAGVIEQEGPHQGRYFLGLRVDLTLDGTAVPALRYGPVGVGFSRGEAIREAVEDWSRFAGTALVPALTVPAEIDAGRPPGFRIFPGVAGSRGALEGGSFDDLQRALFQAIQPFAQALAASDVAFHAIAVSAMADGRGFIEGQCRVDGRDSPELLAAIGRLPWPRGAPHYMFKQFFVLRAAS